MWLGSSQDKYVPIHSARIELCKPAIKDNSTVGAAYRYAEQPKDIFLGSKLGGGGVFHFAAVL